MRAPLLAALCALLVAVAGAAQEKEPPPPKPEEPPAPEVIPVPQVADQAEQLGRGLVSVAEAAKPTPEVDALEADLEGAQEILAGLARESAAAVERGVSLDDLVSLENEWLLATDELAKWRHTLTRRAEALEAALAEVDGYDELWARTRDEARKSSAPPAVMAQIDAARASIAGVEKQVRSRRSSVLSIQNQVAKAELQAFESLEAIRAAKGRIQSQLFRPSAPPAWRAVGALARPAEIWAELRSSFQRELERSRVYVGRAGSQIAAQLLLLVALAAFLLWLRDRSRRWPDGDPRRETAAPLLEKPYAAATLLAILAAPALHPRAPWLVVSGLQILALFPALRLLPGLLDRGLHPALYALAGFLVLDQVRHLLEATPVLERAVFGVQMLGAAAMVAWLIRPARLAHIPRGEVLPGIVAPAIRLGLVLFLVSFAANLLGFLPLARILGEGTLASAYSALMLYAGVRVVRAGVSLALRSSRMQRLHMVRLHRDRLIQRLRTAVRVGAMLWWFWIVATAFRLREPALDAGARVLAWRLRLGTIDISLADVLAFVVTLGGAVLIARLLRFVLDTDVFPRVRLSRGIPNAIGTTLQYTLIVFGTIFAFAAAGLDWSRFTVLAGALGVGVGFGLQNVVNNFFSGLILLYERPIQVGDTVELGTLMGDVRRIGIRSSTVRTWQGAEVIVPNAMLISDQVVNWTLSDRHRRIELQVGVAYGTDPDQVLALLERVARENPDVASHPPPLALFLGFGDSSLDFELRAWSHRFETAHITRSQLAVAVNRALREAGIEIPFPQRDLHIRSGLHPGREAPAPGPAPDETSA